MTYNIHMLSGSKKMKGFTLVELMVTTSIFVFITALMIVKYGSFNQGTLLTNLAYDVALTIRTAQTYGLSVQRKDSNLEFKYAYGVNFDTNTLYNKQIILFIDSVIDGNYSNSTELVSTYNIKRGAKIAGFCTVTCSVPNTTGYVNISFLRPNPDAVIHVNGSTNNESYLKIFVQATDGSMRSVTVRQTGQIDTMLMSHYSKFKKGFTLIEMIVSLAIFSVVAVIALGSLVRIMSANQKAQSLHSAMTNIGFALESMSRELRMGVGIDGNTSNTIKFGSMRTYPNTSPIQCYLDSAYSLVPSVISNEFYLQKAEATGCGNPPDASMSGPLGTSIDMLSPSIHLTTGTSLNVISGKYKLITIKLVGYVGTKEKTKTYFNVQTSVSQRVFD